MINSKDSSEKQDSPEDPLQKLREQLQRVHEISQSGKPVGIKMIGGLVYDVGINVRVVQGNYPGERQVSVQNMETKKIYTPTISEFLDWQDNLPEDFELDIEAARQRVQISKWFRSGELVTAKLPNGQELQGRILDHALHIVDFELENGDVRHVRVEDLIYPWDDQVTPQKEAARSQVESVQELPPRFEEALKQLRERRDRWKKVAESNSGAEREAIISAFEESAMRDIRHLAEGGFDSEGLTEPGGPYEGWSPEHFQLLVKKLEEEE